MKSLQAKQLHAIYRTLSLPLPLSAGVRRCEWPEGLQSPDLCVQPFIADPMITAVRAGNGNGCNGAVAQGWVKDLTQDGDIASNPGPSSDLSDSSESPSGKIERLTGEAAFSDGSGESWDSKDETDTFHSEVGECSSSGPWFVTKMGFEVPTEWELMSGSELLLAMTDDAWRDLEVIQVLKSALEDEAIIMMVPFSDKWPQSFEDRLQKVRREQEKMRMGACLARKRMEEEATRLSEEFEVRLGLKVQPTTPPLKNKRGGKRHRHRQRVREESLDESRQQGNNCCTPLPPSVGVRRCGWPEGLQSPDLCIQPSPADPMITEAWASSSCCKSKQTPSKEADEDGSLLSEDDYEESKYIPRRANIKGMPHPKTCERERDHQIGGTQCRQTGRFSSLVPDGQ